MLSSYQDIIIMLLLLSRYNYHVITVIKIIIMLLCYQDIIIMLLLLSRYNYHVITVIKI